jgi:Phytanoyl-CoA dioxygenase (PhyH)
MRPIERASALCHHRIVRAKPIWRKAAAVSVMLARCFLTVPNRRDTLDQALAGRATKTRISEETMPKMLTEDEVTAYRDRGYHFPIEALSASEVAGFRRRLEDYEAESGGPIKGEMRHRSHVLFTWIDEMTRHPKILDAIEDVLGPDILCWNTSFFIKEARDPGFVSWHQDATYWVSAHPMSRPPGSRCRRPTRFPAA